MSTSGASKKRVKLDNYDAKVSCKSSATGVSFEHEMDDDVDCDAVDSVAALHLNEMGGHISLDESNPLFVLPLHSYLSVEEQSRVFQAPPGNWDQSSFWDLENILHVYSDFDPILLTISTEVAKDLLWV